MTDRGVLVTAAYLHTHTDTHIILYIYIIHNPIDKLIVNNLFTSDIKKERRKKDFIRHYLYACEMKTYGVPL